MDTKHEKGPWKVTSASGGCARIGTDKTHTIAVVGGAGQEGADANASRIIQCINLCEGMDLEEMMAMRTSWKNSKQGRKAKIHEYNFSCRGTRAKRTCRAEAKV